MTEHYPSAASRHLGDAQALQQQGATDNAAYLAGYTIECTLKALLQVHGHPTPSKYGHELSTLQGTALELALILSPGLRRYRLDKYTTTPDPFAPWAPLLRYTKTGTIDPTQAENLIGLANEFFRSGIIAMILDGRLEMAL